MDQKITKRKKLKVLENAEILKGGFRHSDDLEWLK